MTEISDELAEMLVSAFGLDRDRNLPKPMTDASSGNALSKKGGGRALEGGAKRARATAQQREEARAPMGKRKGKVKAPHSREPRKGALDFYGHTGVCGARLIGCVKSPDVVDFVPEADSRPIPAVLSQENAFRQEPSALATIGSVLAEVSETEVCNPIVGGVAVDVVDQPTRPFPIEKPPCHPVSANRATAEADGHVSLPIDKARLLTGAPFVSRVARPAEKTSFRVIGDIVGNVLQDRRNASIVPPFDRRGVRFRVYRVAPLLAVVVDGEE